MEKKPENPINPSGYVLLSLVFLLVLGFTVFFLRSPDPQPLELLIPSPTPEATPEPIGIYILGAVQNPGVYFMPPGSRVIDAIAAAGGETAEADLARVNLAARLEDEEQIYVPRLGEETASLQVLSTPTSQSATQSGLININTATAQELETLPGIGPALAQRIVDFRTANGPFASIEQIIDVSGIGEGIFSDIKDLITVGS